MPEPNIWLKTKSLRRTRYNAQMGASVKVGRRAIPSLTMKQESGGAVLQLRETTHLSACFRVYLLLHRDTPPPMERWVEIAGP